MGSLDRCPVLGGAFFIGLSVMVGGCNAAGNPPPESEKFELKQDKQGRVIRLNKATGEVFVVDGTRLIPVREGNGDDRGGKTPSGAPKAQQTSSRNARERSVEDEKRALRAPVESVPSTVVQAGDVVTTTETTPVFITANQGPTPLKVAAKGATFRLVGSEGDWYQVEFNDPRWGKRVGFVRKKQVTVASTERSPLEPVDVSLPELK